MTSAAAGLTSPTANAEDDLTENIMNAGVSGAFGLGAKGVMDTLARGFTGASDKVTDEVRDAVARLRKSGVKPRMSQITDSRLLKNICLICWMRLWHNRLKAKQNNGIRYALFAKAWPRILGTTFTSTCGLHSSRTCTLRETRRKMKICVWRR
jgi:hypothetical protein